MLYNIVVVLHIYMYQPRVYMCPPIPEPPSHLHPHPIPLGCPTAPAQDEIKIARTNINNLRYADDTTLMAESEEELKSLLMKVKVESEKVGLKAQHSENEDHGIWSHHFMGNRWGNSRNSVRLYFLRLQSNCRW